MKLIRPIAFYPELAKEFGSVKTALYYQQLSFWSDKGGREDGWIYKTKQEMEEETTLSRREQDSCRLWLEENGYIETRIMKASGSPTLHFRLLRMFMITKAPNELVQNRLMEKYKSAETTITENTTENTTLHASRENGELSYETPEDLLPRKVFKRKQAISEGFKGHLNNELFSWAESRIGQKFGNPMKQKVALSKMLQFGRTPEQIKECWISLENDEYWSDKGFDFMTVLNQISKARRRGPRHLKIY